MMNLTQIVKYLLEGAAVAVAAFYIPRRNMNLQEVAMIALTAAATFAVLDMFSPSVARGARTGSGFAVGTQMVGGGDGVASCSADSESQSSQGEEEFEQETVMGNDDVGAAAFTSQPALVEA